MPDALKGNGNWQLVPESAFSTFDWRNVTSIAFYSGDYIFSSEPGREPSVSVGIKMSSIYSGKPNCVLEEMPVTGYVLYNTCRVYQETGDSKEIVAYPSSIYTKVIVQYDTAGMAVLPTTGGEGVRNSVSMES